MTHDILKRPVNTIASKKQVIIIHRYTNITCSLTTYIASDTICHDRGYLLPRRPQFQPTGLCSLNKAFEGISVQKVRLFLLYPYRDNRKPVSFRSSERTFPEKTRLVTIELLTAHRPLLGTQQTVSAAMFGQKTGILSSSGNYGNIHSNDYD